MEKQSVLSCSHELSINDSVPFQDVSVKNIVSECCSTDYRKPTDVGKRLNPVSESPDPYETSVIRPRLHGAMRAMRAGQRRCTQILGNNGFSSRQINKELRYYRNRVQHNKAMPNQLNTTVSTPIDCYCNQINSVYRTGERVLRDLIDRA